MGNMRRPKFVIAALGIAALALVGCSPQTEPTEQPGQTTPPATQTPTATESSAPATAASIVLSVTSIQVVDSAGTVMSENDYFEPAADVVATLTAALGTDPIVSRYEGGGDSPPGTSYDWGGFAIRDGEWTTEAPYYPEFSVLLTAATVGGLTISTSDGVAVGDSFSAVAAAHPEHVRSYADGPLQLEWTELPKFPEGYGVDIVPALSVLVVDSEHNDVVSRIITPAMNWGA
ncbi:hypothetical protein EV379_2205 [Microterricola gilva]|uniref:Uncharacterized protein n=1 Tax=Microterricola gilva TaxID=393267 RepID=A0A4V2GAX1_9MICO|nr:hypothetical protein [Microterricola gilva]RZU65866.1 hypothetical protein EV379_2205 [Microterricola gilva]